MKHWIRLLCLSLLSIVVGTASAQNVAKIGSTEYATIEEAVADWGPGKTLTLLADVTTTSTVVVEVNATKSTSNWTLDLGDYTWTANGCNAFQLYAAGGTVMNQNYGLKVYANQNGGIKAAGKYCIEAKYDNSKTRYRPRLEIHGGTYEGAYIIYYYSSSWSNSNIENGPSTHIFMSNDGTEPIFNGNFGMYKCPLTINAGYFNGTSFNTYPVGSTADTYLKGGHFKTISAFPSASNNKGIQFGNYKVFVKSDASIDIVNGAPATYEAKATKTLLLSANQGVNYSDYVYYEKANDAIQKYSSGTIEIVLAPGVTATQGKTLSSSGTLTINATAEGSSYTGNVVLSNNNAKLVMIFPEGSGHYGVTVNSGTLHVVESIADGIVTRTYSRISNVSNPEAKVGDTSYSTVYDAFYAVDGTTDNKTIVLQKDVTNAGIITNGTATGGDGKTVATFDLNGKSIGIGSVAAGNNADYTLTIIDSSEGKTGTVTNSDASLFILALTGINDYSGSYTLKIQAGTWQFDPSAVNINGEIHNLVDEGYFAKDNGNGTWTVGELPSVAKIGDAKYPTLQSAVDAAQQIGGAVTVNIIDDISGETVTIKEVANFKLTIDGQKDASSNYTVDAVIVVDGLRGNGGSTTNGASVTLQNIAFVKTTATDGIQASHYPHNLTIQDCTYSGSDTEKWFLNASVDGPLYGVTVKNVTVEHARLVYANMADDAVFQNITATNDIKVGFNVKTSGTALIENCQVTTGKYAFRDYNDGYEGTFTLKDNTFISTSEASDEGVIVNRGGTVGTAHVNVESGTYTGHIKVLNNKEGVLAISGGYFSEEFPQEYIAADLVAQGKVCVPATDKEGFYTIGDPHYVAQIGEAKYVSLQAALDAAHEATGDVTIELLDDISSYSIVHQKAGLNLTIDGKDKKVSSNIIVDGDGRSSGTETLTIQNIKFEGDGTDFCSGTSSFVEVPSCKTEGTPYYTNKYNYAHNITVTNCSFTSTTSGLTMAAIRSNSGAGAYNVVISDCTGANLHSLAQLTGTTGGSITGNTVSGSESFVNVNGGAGDFTISGNTFTSAEGADGYGVRENGSSTAVITLTDNTFTAASALVMGKSKSSTNGTINVESGTYVGDIVKSIADAATGKIVISGGKFSAPIADPAYAEFIAEGFCGVNGLYPEDTAAPNGIGTAVATVTTGTTVIPYASLEAAFAAAQDGETITLLQDITLTEDLTWNTEGDATLTLDLGEYKITKGNYSVKLVQGQTVNASKSAGIFTTDEVGYYVKSTKNADDTYTYTVEEADLEYTDANGKVSYKAWSNTVVSGSGTYKLLKDITAPARIAPGIAATNITLDLNGHTLTSTATDVAVLLSRNGTSSSPKTFDIIDSSDEKGGKLIANTAANMAIQVSGNYNTVTIGEGVTIDGGCVGLMKENETLVVNGTINGGDDYAVVTNGSTTKNANITIKDGAVLTSDITAMYLAGNEGLVATIEGGSITGGDTGIEIRAGQLTVTGGTITSTASEYSCVANANGTTTEGAAVAVVQHTTQLPINVTISDGSLSGVNNIIVSDIQNGSLTDVEVTVKDELIGESVLPTDYKWVSNGDGTSSLGLKEYIAAIGSTKYETLQEAVDAAGTSAATITLLTEAATEGVITGNGVKVQNGQDITFDLNGLTYNVDKTVGSTGTETNGFQLLKGSTVKFTNGTVTSSTAQILLQNYSDLTLEDVTINAGSADYAVSNNFGSMTATGNTVINAKNGGMAFDLWYGMSAVYDDGIKVTFDENFTGEVKGKVEYGHANRVTDENWQEKAALEIKCGNEGKFDIEFANASANALDGANIQISGGVFSEEPAEEYLAEGYVTSDNEDEETKATYPYAVMTKEDAGIFELYDLLASNTSHVPQKTIYTLEEDKAAKQVTYYREFSNNTAGHRQCWFVPFDYTITEADLEKCTFYRIHMFSADSDEEGVVQDENSVVMKIAELTAGYTLKANKPYIIKPKAAGVIEFVAEDVTLKAKNDDKLLTVATSVNDYNFFGVYDSYGPTAANEWFSLNNNGNLKWNDANQKLGPYRWYIKPTYTGDDYANIAFIIDEEGEETTEIASIISDPDAEIEGFYTVGGVKHDKPIRGTLNIVKYTDGRTKKVYVK